jgi:4-hydroxy-tetrahydrodipicolinate reductase
LHRRGSDLSAGGSPGRLDSLPQPAPGSSPRLLFRNAGREDDVANGGHLAHEAEKAKGGGIMTSICLFGASGRMGQAIAEVVCERDDVNVVEDECDVFVDFSAPDGLEHHLEMAVEAGRPIVVGTTGLTPQHKRLIDAAAEKIAVLQAANMSLGVNLLAHLVRETAARLGEEWDIEIVEMHHRHKVDAPSGTGLLLGGAAAEGRGVELRVVSDRGRDGNTGPRKEGHIGFAALRGGSVAGDHQVIFASDGERIELGHRAESRTIFARGAVQAALWMVGKPAGRYTMSDVLGLK